jgi:hypothetical protein
MLGWYWVLERERLVTMKRGVENRKHHAFEMHLNPMSDFTNSRDKMERKGRRVLFMVQQNDDLFLVFFFCFFNMGNLVILTSKVLSFWVFIHFHGFI